MTIRQCIPVKSKPKWSPSPMRHPRVCWKTPTFFPELYWAPDSSRISGSSGWRCMHCIKRNEKSAVTPVVGTGSWPGGMEEGVIFTVRLFLGASACLNCSVIAQTPDAYASGHLMLPVMVLSYEHSWHGGCSNCNTLLLAAFNSHQISSSYNACDCQIRPSVNTKTCKLLPNSWQSCLGNKLHLFSCLPGKRSDGRRAPRPRLGRPAPSQAAPCPPAALLLGATALARHRTLGPSLSVNVFWQML
nr:PREDICTED: uncharacterized protein LOC106499673 [Apteryx mantelli mantelli]